GQARIQDEDIASSEQGQQFVEIRRIEGVSRPPYIDEQRRAGCTGLGREKLRANAHAFLALKRELFVISISVSHCPSSGALRCFRLERNWPAGKPAEHFIFELRD